MGGGGQWRKSQIYVQQCKISCVEVDLLFICSLLYQSHNVSIIATGIPAD